MGLPQNEKKVLSALTAATGFPLWSVLPNTSRLLYCPAWQTWWRGKSFGGRRSNCQIKHVIKCQCSKAACITLWVWKKAVAGTSWFITRCLSLPWPTRKTTNTSGSVRRGGRGARVLRLWKGGTCAFNLPASKCPVATTAKSRKT